MNNLKIEKPWGYERIIEMNDKYMVKELSMKQGECCSLQYHDLKLETVFVLQGVLNLTHNNKDYIILPGQHFTIKPKEVHRMTAIEDCKYLECSTPENEDVIRLEDNYGREST